LPAFKLLLSAPRRSRPAVSAAADAAGPARPGPADAESVSRRRRRRRRRVSGGDAIGRRQRHLPTDSDDTTS